MLDSYHAQGFFIVDGFSAPEVGHRMLDDVIGVVREADKPGTAPEGMFIAPEAQDDLTGINPEDTVSKVFTLHDRPAFLSFLHDERVAGVLLDLIGPDANLYWDQAVYKKPEKPRRFPWHQDNGYTFIEPQQYLTVWVALNDATVENGCPWVAPERQYAVTRSGTPLNPDRI